MEDDRYHVSDPFFVVKCAGCGSAYWSTRRINRQCMECGSSIVTSLPEKRKEGHGK